MTELLEQILQPHGLSVVLQPIFEIVPEGRRIHSLECLTRGPRGTSAENAEVLFAYIRLKQREIPLDRVCLTGALEAAGQLPRETRLSLNVHTSTLCWDEDFVEFVADATSRTGIEPSRLTLEVIEHQPVRDSRRLIETLDRLRSLGLQIALDDIGDGHSTFKRLLDCDPHFFKIDRSVIHGCSSDPRRTAVIQSIVLLAERFGAQVIAEGVENTRDLERILDLGILLAQGYALARPLSPHQAVQFLQAEAEASRCL